MHKPRKFTFQGAGGRKSEMGGTRCAPGETLPVAQGWPRDLHVAERGSGLPGVPLVKALTPFMGAPASCPHRPLRPRLLVTSQGWGELGEGHCRDAVATNRPGWFGSTKSWINALLGPKRTFPRAWRTPSSSRGGAGAGRSSPWRGTQRASGPAPQGPRARPQPPAPDPPDPRPPTPQGTQRLGPGRQRFVLAPSPARGSWLRRGQADEGSRSGEGDPSGRRPRARGQFDGARRGERLSAGWSLCLGLRTAVFP